MANEVTVFEKSGALEKQSDFLLPAIIVEAGETAVERYIEYFTAQIRNKNTRAAYGRAVRNFFDWCEGRDVTSLDDISTLLVAGYVEMMTGEKAALTVKQHVSALRQLFDWLVKFRVMDQNPAIYVKPPKYKSLKGTTPILLSPDARALINSIPLEKVIGFRDRALISLMTYTFSRVSAAVSMNVGDVYEHHHRLFVRLLEKGGNYIEMPCNHNLEQYLREYIEAAGIADQKDKPLFRTIGRETKRLTETRLHRTEAWAMVKRRARQAGVKTPGISPHSFRGTGITAYLDNPGARLEVAQQMAGHADPATTRKYDRREDIVTLDEVERIGI